jgi:hypothetical protein
MARIASLPTWPEKVLMHPVKLHSGFRVESPLESVDGFGASIRASFRFLRNNCGVTVVSDFSAAVAAKCNIQF